MQIAEITYAGNVTTGDLIGTVRYYAVYVDGKRSDSSRTSRSRIRKPRYESREGRSVPGNRDFCPSDGAKTVTLTEYAIFPENPNRLIRELNVQDKIKARTEDQTAETTEAVLKLMLPSGD